MHDPTLPPSNPPAPGADDPLVADQGRWGLDLWNGSAWFSEWFVQRLQWAGGERTRLDNLRPYLPDGAWESLLTAIRHHLEQQIPLELTICAQLADGRKEWWQVSGAAEHNAGGQPVYLSGTMCVGAEQRGPAGGEQP